MPSPSSDDTRTGLERAVAAAMKQRAELRKKADQLKEEAEADFWRTIDGFRHRYHGAQTDIVRVTGYTRDHIAKQSLKHKKPQDGGVGEHR